MKRFLRDNYHHIGMFLVFVVLLLIMQWYYPRPTVTWDTDYYLKHSRTGNAGIRPMGYSSFLSFLYYFSHTLKLVVWVQYLLYYLSVVSLVVVFHKIFRTGKAFTLVMGTLLLAEPTAMYMCNVIYSDELFAIQTVLYLATLLYFVHSRRWVYLLLHVLFMYWSIDTRFSALFYPFFSILVIVLAMRGLWLKLVCIVLLFGTYKYSYNRYVQMNEKTFGVPIHSAFSGWTLTNNVMYALPRIHVQPKYIMPEHLRETHRLFDEYTQNTDFFYSEIRADYLWDGRTPMNIMRQRAADSMVNAGVQPGDYQDMFIVAPRLQEYGWYMQTNFPYEYVMGYMFPNVQTMLSPDSAEMDDYYMHTQLSDSNKMRYNIKEEDIYCRRDIYKERLNTVNRKIYQYRLALFALACGIFLLVCRRLPKNELIAVVVTVAFVVIFYLLLLYSSRFLYRYIMPVFPPMTAIILLSLRSLVQHFRSLKL